MAKAWPKSHGENPNLSAPPDLVMGLVFQEMCRRHAESIFGVTGKKGVLKSQESRACFLSDPTHRIVFGHRFPWCNNSLGEDLDPYKVIAASEDN